MNHRNRPQEIRRTCVSKNARSHSIARSLAEMSSLPAHSSPPLRLVYPGDEQPRRSTPLDRQKAIAANRAYRRSAAAKQVASEVRRAAINPDLDPADPRWVLAMEARKSLDGSALNPQKRQRLLRLANRLGMRLFDANLVLAIVQDEARRGALPQRVEAEAPELLDRLRIIPHDQSTRRRSPSARRSESANSDSTRMLAALLLSLTIAGALAYLAINWLLAGT